MIERFKKLFFKITRRLVGLPINKKQEILLYAMAAQKSWNMPPGDYLEFGVFQGRAFIQAYHEARKNGLHDMRFFAFDSFEGLPAFEGKDAEHESFHSGQYACSEKAFLKNIKRGGADLSRVKTIKGFFDQSLTSELYNELGIKRAAVIFIDCDLYESTVPVLDFIVPFLTIGTVLIFDDWFSFGGDDNAGEIKAVDEWLDKNKQIRLRSYRDFATTGKSFVVSSC